MNIDEIGRGGEVTTISTEVDTASTPAVTEAEFQELATLQNKQTVTKSNILDTQDYVASVAKRLEEAKKSFEDELSVGQAKVDELRAELSTTTELMRTRFTEIIEQYGFEGTASVNISQETPHVITLLDPQTLQPAG